MVPKALLDTNALSAVMADDSRLSGKELVYQRSHRRFTVSGITRYEIERGLLARGASAQLRTFGRLFVAIEVLPVDPAVLTRAAEVWSSLRRIGVQIADCDCLIAATALVHGLVLVTHNTKDFARIAGLTLDDWLA